MFLVSGFVLQMSACCNELLADALLAVKGLKEEMKDGKFFKWIYEGKKNFFTAVISLLPFFCCSCQGSLVGLRGDIKYCFADFVCKPPKSVTPSWPKVLSVKGGGRVTPN